MFLSLPIFSSLFLSLYIYHLFLFYLYLSVPLPHPPSVFSIFSYFLVINADYTVSSKSGVSAQAISALVTNFTTSGAFTATLATSFPNATATILSSPVGTYLRMLLYSTGRIVFLISILPSLFLSSFFLLILL